jgi:hypothetical protein
MKTCSKENSDASPSIALSILQLAYDAYLLVGPLALADSITGAPLMVVFSYGLWGKPHIDDPWTFIPCVDTMYLAFINFIFCVVPATLWVACVLGRRQMAVGGRRQGVTRQQIGAFLVLGWFCGTFLYAKAVSFMGLWVVVASPGYAWALPLAALLVASCGAAQEAAPVGRRKGV